MAKHLLIESAEIEFSANDKIERGWFASLNLKGTLPGCRKSVSLTVSPTAGAIWVKPMYGYSGRANVSTADWRRIIESAKSVEYKLEYARIPITEEMDKEARHENCERMIEAAERSLASAHPTFKPTFDPVVIEIKK